MQGRCQLKISAADRDAASALSMPLQRVQQHADQRRAAAAHDLADLFGILICIIALRKTLVETATWQVVWGRSPRLPHPPALHVSLDNNLP